MFPERSVCARTGLPGRLVIGVAATTLALAACYGHSTPSGAPCVTHDIWVGAVAGPVLDKVDLLLMVDNSGSMAEEQASLAMELPRLMRVLSSGDRTGDGATADDFPAVRNLHIGVITSDMGVAGFNVPTCTVSPMFGDDGLLRTRGNTSIAGCMATYPRFLEYMPGVSPETPWEFGAEVRCVATPGTRGCGFEQQLEATLKAITPSTSTLDFLGGTRGHGDVENVGFIRPDSVLALILLTDEEDCSIQSGYEDIFNQLSPTFTGDLNLRCYLYKEAQWPVQRYIDGFKALRVGRERQLIFGAITGVPLDLIRTGTPDYGGILADTRLIEAIDTSPGTTGARLVPSCNVPGRGIAFPPRRIVEVAQAFGDNGIVQSICQENYTAAIDAIVARIAAVLGNTCLSRALPRGTAGLADCDIIEHIPRPGTFAGQPTSCAELTGVHPEPARVDPDGSIDCTMIQLATTTEPRGDGWYYDDFSAETTTACGASGRRIEFTVGARPRTGIAVTLECLDRSTTSVDIPCATDRDCPSSLSCDLGASGGVCRDPICLD